ncbi:PQQ-dependent sugar dehydrogenase [Marinicauda algicola]|uniref:PQQ-dependent sugar dehydrogenase n=1 Tax=Marinicauda algicola TaxID=2029849 RepID=A0A4S2GZ36_9PROT|nr:PQQ-dependent sugar dehydrogenase [Marinicauda algicola]TGY88374.1 PQQ-dependent sugar dehydrogenase [Marinicauda algicola]
MLRPSASLAACLVLAAPALGQVQTEPYESEQATFLVETVAEGLDYPWSIAFLPGGAMLVSEREGGLRVIEADGTLREAPVAGLPDDVLVLRQGGLMEIALHPDFEDNRIVYLSYAEGSEDANRTALYRARLSEDLSRLEQGEDIFRVNFDKAAGFHFGGRILFQGDHLYLTLGEGGRYEEESQNPENHLGGVVRLELDGTPAGADIGNGAPGLFTYGHRNVQGIDVNPSTGSIWTVEHGPRGGDELNILEAGTNYGWPEITYGINYDGTIVTEEREREGLAQPVWYWNPSIAPAGIAFYDGEAFEHWQGDLFVAALAGSQLQRLEMDGDRVIGVEPLLADAGLRFRDVKVGPDGALYVLVDDYEGAVLRITPAG